MKRTRLTVLSGALLIAAFPGTSGGDPLATGKTDTRSEMKTVNSPMKGNRISIRVGEKTFVATLADNPAASAFRNLLPLRLKMSDLHGNEKFHHLPSRLPSDDTNPGTIRTGDLLLWNSRSVVLFYQTFPTSYSYTALGRIDNPEGLSNAAGTGDVTITFETR